MRLLFITQKVDKDDTILGVYHRWLEEMAEHFETINVICLYRGRVKLPENVSIYSLGKENSTHHKSRILNRIRYIFRFLKYAWNLRKDYDRVFVHMNPEYVILGGLFWKLLRKKIFLWYNHPLGGLRARLAIALADKVFCTSPFAFAKRFKKTWLMPVGIDSDFFRRIPEISKRKNSILYLGRISPIKKVEYLIEAALELNRRNKSYILSIVGGPAGPSDGEYARELERRAQLLVEKGRIVFKPGVPNSKVPEIYNQHEIFVNLTPTGSFDKTIIEAMLCETLVATSNKAVWDALPAESRFQENDPKDLADKLISLFNLSDSAKHQNGLSMREYAAKRHSLSALIKKLTHALNA